MTENYKNIEIDILLYTKEAVMNTMYKFTDKFYVKAEPISDSKISVIFTAKDNSSVTEETVNQFFNELIDQQIRINVEKEYKTIREEIVKKAFASINK